MSRKRRKSLNQRASTRANGSQFICTFFTINSPMFLLDDERLHFFPGCHGYFYYHSTDICLNLSLMLWYFMSNFKEIQGSNSLQKKNGQTNVVFFFEKWAMFFSEIVCGNVSFTFSPFLSRTLPSYFSTLFRKVPDPITISHFLRRKRCLSNVCPGYESAFYYVTYQTVGSSIRIFGLKKIRRASFPLAEYFHEK